MKRRTALVAAAVAVIMKYKYQILWVICLIPVAVFVVLVWWQYFKPEAPRAVDPARSESPRLTAVTTKPICASPVNPNVAAPTDCIPQHLANLPPDPGEAGKLTIDGNDSDKDGIRDDVQRWIAQNWGHSPLAVKALTMAAERRLRDVHYGDSLGREETRKQFAADSMRKSACTSDLETRAMLEGRALESVRLQVTNTPERWKRSRDFDYMFANSITPGFEGTNAEACGFDVEALIAQSGVGSNPAGRAIHQGFAFVASPFSFTAVP